MKQVLIDLLPLIALMFVVCAASLHVFIYSGVRSIFKFLIIPAVLSTCVAVPVIFTSMMGYAVWLPPPTDFIVISHRTVLEGSKKVAIEIWIREKNKRTRLFGTPYSKELEKQLEQARKAQAGGMDAHMKRRGGKTNRQSDADDSPFDMDLQFPPMPPKDSVGEDGVQRMPQAPEPDEQKPALTT